MPGSSPTIDRRCPVIALNNVDLPTFGLPTMTIEGRLRSFGHAIFMIACGHESTYVFDARATAGAACGPAAPEWEKPLVRSARGSITSAGEEYSRSRCSRTARNYFVRSDIHRRSHQASLLRRIRFRITADPDSPSDPLFRREGRARPRNSGGRVSTPSITSSLGQPFWLPGRVQSSRASGTCSVTSSKKTVRELMGRHRTKGDPGISLRLGVARRRRRKRSRSTPGESRRPGRRP